MKQTNKIARGLALVLTLLLLGTACTQAPQEGGTPEGGGTVTMAVNQEGVTLDPNKGSSRYEDLVRVNIFDLLVEKNENNEYLPWLATDWEISPDGKTYTFTLRDDVTFHDGTPFNAEAVKFNFDRIVDPELASLKAVGLMGSYQSSEVLEEFVLQVNFANAYPAFLDALSQPAMSLNSPTAVAEWGEDYGQHPVGTGPFVFEEWVQGETITMTRNPDYNWPRPTATHTGPANIETLIYRLVPEGSSRYTTLMTGEVDATIRVPEQNVQELLGHDDFALIRSVVTGSPVMVMLNANKFPTDDVLVRQAIQHIVPREDIGATSFFNAAELAYGPISTINPGYSDVVEGYYAYDPDAAIALLEDAGWSELGDDGIRVKDGQRLSMEYIGFSGSPTTDSAMQLLQAEMKAVGIELNLTFSTGSDIQRARSEGDHNLCHLTWMASDPSFMSIMFHSKNIGGWNFTHYADVMLDQMLDAAEFEIDPAVRMEQYADIQEYVTSEALYFATVAQMQTLAVRNGIAGFALDAHGEHPIWYGAYFE